MARTLVLILTGVCLSLISVALHAEADPIVHPADVQSAEAENPMVCKRMTPTGSRIARRYCRRQSEWDSMKDDGQKAARDALILESQYGYRGVGPGGPNPY